MPEKSQEEVLANRRRQAYYRRRRQVQNQSVRGSGVEVARMESSKVTALLMGEMYLLLAALADGSSPELHHRAQVVSDCIHELYERGAQLSLF